MRIHRISLKDFRGVDSLDVELAASGVTIVEGRNEIGKTSIADAFMLLLDAKDSSNSKQIKDVQPIGRDVGPFVEAEFSVGPYRLTYRKQWVRGRKTELDIAEPQHQQLTGEAAHNRMLEILDHETDPDLFRALRYQQGVAISQAAVAQAPSLATALDAAAGGTGRVGGAGQDALFDRVEQERQRYFTPGGAVLATRRTKAAQLAELHAEVAAAEDRIRKLEETAERQHRIETELVELRAKAPGVAEQISESTQAVHAIEEVERGVERARLEHEQAESALRECTTARDTRTGLIAAAASAAAALAALEADIASNAPGLTAANIAVADAEQVRDTERFALDSAEQEATGRQRLVELLELRLARDQFRERQERVFAADETVKAAERILAGCALNDTLLLEIDEAAAKVAVAQGRAAAGKPRVVVEALQPVRLTVNGNQTAAVPGTPLEEIVTAEVEVIVGDVARVVVSRTESAGDADDMLVQAERGLNRLLHAGGVASQGEARELVHDRLRQAAERDNATQRRDEALRELQPAQLTAKVARAEERLAALEAEHNLVAGGAESLDDARAVAHDADARVRDARALETDCRTKLKAANGALRVLEDYGIEQRTRLDGAHCEVGRCAAELEERRGATSDADMGAKVEAANTRAAAAAEELELAESELAAGDALTARATLENAQKLKERLVADTSAREVEKAETRTHLELEGHKGLSDRRAEGLAKLEDLQRDVDSENVRAAAVERLNAILSERREHALQTYVGPLRDKVNAYARILYGPEVDVAIDHLTFDIASRTLNGTTVPFASLSGGAREQLAVLARLACAALVSPANGDGNSGGVPVIIDDALGYSDPDRLEKIGAAFGVAGKDCQVIVLTCEPGRYRGIGGAKVVSLG